MAAYPSRPLENFMFSTKFRANRTAATSSDSRPGVIFWAQNLSAVTAEYRGLLVQVDSLLDEVNVYNNLDGSYDNIGGASYANPPNNTFRYITVNVYNKRLQVWLSSDSYQYEPFIDIGISSGIEGGGLVGFRVGRAGLSHTYDYSNYDLMEIGNHYTKGDILEKAFKAVGINGVSIENELNEWEDMVPNAGASWVESGGELTRISGVSGWNTYMTLGNTFLDYVFEVEIKGVSGSVAMPIAGNTSTFYGAWSQMGEGVSTGFDFIMMPIRETKDGRGVHLNPLADTWYKWKLVKEGTLISTYIDDTLLDHGQGISLENKANGSNVGVAVFNGSSVSFRNPRISVLDDPVDSASWEAGRSLDSTISRHLPPGYQINWKGDHVEIFRVGTSRGEHNLGLSVVKSGPGLVHSNTDGHDVVSAVPRTGLVVEQNNNERIAGQLELGRAKFHTDLNLDTIGNARAISRAIIADGNQDVENIDVEVAPRVDLEQYDKVNLVDHELGISGSYQVNNVDTSWSNSGQYRQSIRVST
jgi:hypothetical protein